MTTIVTILKYAMTGASDVRERATFKYEFPQKIYAVVE